MQVTRERNESRSVIRLEGECTIASAAELKIILLEALSAGEDLRLVLESVEEIDITVMQLLWAAEREANRSGAKIAFLLSDGAAKSVREAGFEQLTGKASE